MSAPRSADISAHPAVGWRTFARRGGMIVGILLAASPAAAALMGALVILGGIAPTVTAWLQRSVLNSLVPQGLVTGHATASAGRATAGGAARAAAGQAIHPASADHIVVMAVILGAVGLMTAVLPYSRTYIQAVLRRRMGWLSRIGCSGRSTLILGSAGSSPRSFTTRSGW